jgi:HAD superfamily hydrolase (TIGR01509 family)
MEKWPGAILFDFDGVLVNSEPLHVRAYLETSAKWAIPLTREEYFRELIGFDDRGAWTHLFKKNNRAISSAELDRVIAQKLDVMRRLFETGDFEPMPGVRRFVARLRERRIPAGICTGALREEVETMLDGIRMRDSFDVLVAAEDVKIGKPDPAGYLLTARRLSEKIGRALAPADCLVIEDAPSVIRSVRHVGFKVLGVATTYPIEELADADWAVKSLEPDRVAGAIPELDLT